eukprot:SAG11_NODE_7568_length_1128_cov_1.042760_1_plen_166_part_10
MQQGSGAGADVAPPFWAMALATGDLLRLEHESTGFRLAVIVDRRGGRMLLARPEQPYHRLTVARKARHPLRWKATLGCQEALWAVEPPPSPPPSPRPAECEEHELGQRCVLRCEFTLAQAECSRWLLFGPDGQLGVGQLQPGGGGGGGGCGVGDPVCWRRLPPALP